MWLLYKLTRDEQLYNYNSDHNYSGPFTALSVFSVFSVFSPRTRAKSELLMNTETGDKSNILSVTVRSWDAPNSQNSFNVHTRLYKSVDLYWSTEASVCVLTMIEESSLSETLSIFL